MTLYACRALRMRGRKGIPPPPTVALSQNGWMIVWMDTLPPTLDPSSRTTPIILEWPGHSPRVDFVYQLRCRNFIEGAPLIS